MIEEENADNLLSALRRAGFLRERRVVFLQQTVSTNDDALRLAAEGAPSGTIILAELQLGGRGRMGRKWQSSPGHSLTFSYILRPPHVDSAVPQLTLVAGLAVAKAINSHTGLNTAIKWPNDILVSGRKVAGLLCEFAAPHTSAGGAAVIIGIGVNVSMEAEEFTEDVRQRASSLLHCGAAAVSRPALLMAIIIELEAQLQRYDRRGFSPILRDWKQRDATYGRRLVWVDVKGNIVEGLSLGPDENGVLRIVDDAGNTREIVSGDLNLAESA